MDAESWQAIGAVGALLAVGGYNALKARVAVKQAEQAARKAGLAVQQTESTANGFAAQVTDSLGRIEKQVQSVEGKIDRHLEAHANASVIEGRR